MKAKEQTHMEPTILAAAERQMQTWVRTAEIEDRSIRAEEFKRLAAGIQTYLAISREEGAGASEIAHAVGKRLDWNVLDKNLLDRVAEQYQLSRPMLELVDETRSNWFYDVLGTWMDRKIIATEKYVIHLAHIVLSAARCESLVLVGRGAQFILPREKGLAVRLVASQKYRTEQIVSSKDIDETEARRMMEENDCGRRDFVQRFFHHDIEDSHLYDLVINVERVGPAGATEQIVAALSNL